MAFESRHISQIIDCSPAVVAEFAGAYENLPRWAAGLSAGIREDGGHWITDSPMGTVEVVFADGRELGILDHDVHLPDRTVVHNALRVLRNDEVSEVVFTLFRQPGVSDDAYEQDAAMIRADLERLRGILEAD